MSLRISFDRFNSTFFVYFL